MVKEYADVILDEISLALKDLDYDVLWKMVAEIHGANRIFFHSVGRPYINMKNFAMYLKHFGYRHHIIGDAKMVLKQLIEKIPQYDHSEWKKYVFSFPTETEYDESTGVMTPKQILATIGDMVPEDTIVATDVG